MVSKIYLIISKMSNFYVISRVHPILKQQQHQDINANGIHTTLFPSSFSPFSHIQHSSTPPLPHIPAPSPQQPTHPFAYNPLSVAAAAVAHHKSLQQQHSASNISYESQSNRSLETSSHKSGKKKLHDFYIIQ